MSSSEEMLNFLCVHLQKNNKNINFHNIYWPIQNEWQPECFIFKIWSNMIRAGLDVFGDRAFVTPHFYISRSDWTVIFLFIVMLRRFDVNRFGYIGWIWRTQNESKRRPIYNIFLSIHWSSYDSFIKKKNTFCQFYWYFYCR